MRVEPAAGEDGAQRDDDRGGVVVAAHLGDKPAAGLERPADAGEHRLLVAHPVQRGIREHSVEFAGETEPLAVHDPGVDAARPRRGNHVGAGVDRDDAGARGGDLFA